MTLSIIDAQHHRLPNAVLLPALVVFPLLLSGAAAATGDGAALLRALGAGALLFVFFLLVALASPAAMGMGDVKLAALIGLALGWIGWPAVVMGVVAAFAAAALAGLAMVVAGRGTLGTAIPFGPWLFVGAAVGALRGEWALESLLGGAFSL